MHARTQELPLDLVGGAGFVGAFGLALPSIESATGTAILQAQRTLDALRHIQYHKYTKRKNTQTLLGDWMSPEGGGGCV